MTLILLYGGLLIGGLRFPAAWTVVAILLWAMASRNPELLSPVPGKFLWLLWLADAGLSIIFSAEPLRGFAALTYPTTALLLFSMACSWQPQDRKRWFIGLAFSSVVLGLAAMLIPWENMPMVGLLYPYYNYTACVQAAVFCGCLGALGTDYPKSRGWQQATMGLMGFSLLMILLAHSRGALLAIVVSTGIWLWRRGSRSPLTPSQPTYWRLGRRGFRRILFLSTATAIILVSLIPNAILIRTFKLDMPRANTRPALWKAAVDVANDHPLLGEGLGQFDRGFLRHNFPSEGLPTRFSLRSAHAHSEFLQIAAETGWLGLILFLGALGWGLRRGFEANPRTASFTSEAGLAASCAIITQSLFDNVLALPSLRLLLFSCLACAASSPPPLPTVKPFTSSRTKMACILAQGRGTSRPRRRPIALICAIGLGLLLNATAWLPGWMVQRWSTQAMQLSAATARSSEDEQSRDLALSEQLLRKALAVEPKNPELWESLARNALRQTPPNETTALEALVNAAKYHPFNATIPIMQAELMRPYKEWKKVQRLATTAVELEPDCLQGWMLLAESEKRLNHLSEADRAWRKLEDALTRKRVARLQPRVPYDIVVLHFDLKRYQELRRLFPLIPR